VNINAVNLGESHGRGTSFSCSGSFDPVFSRPLAVEYEHIYLPDCDSTGEAKHKVGQCFEFYNRWRPESKPGRFTPNQFSLISLPS
jgi:hypothetical protein